MGIRKNFLSIVTKMEPNTRKLILVGRVRVSVDREHDDTFTVVVPGCLPCRYERAYHAAMHLRTLADMTRPRRD